jgi:hypothetical protein
VTKSEKSLLHKNMLKYFFFNHFNKLWWVIKQLEQEKTFSLFCHFYGFKTLPCELNSLLVCTIFM